MTTLKDILLKYISTSVELCYFENESVCPSNIKAGKFNMALLFKDHRKPKIIEGITDLQIEDIKEQLSAVNSNIKFAEGLPLNWNKIMEEVREKPEEFREAGGWDCLSATTRFTELVIKLEPDQSLPCSGCAEKVRIKGKK